MRLLEVVVASAFVVAAFVAGRVTSGGAVEAGPTQPGSVTKGSPPSVRVVREPCDDPDELVDRLKKELAFERARGLNMAAVAYGVKPEWPTEIPSGYSPANFDDVMSQAMDECGVSLDIAKVDCSEPPCMAVVRGGSENWYSGITNCPVWEQTYGRKGGSQTSETITCDDGTEERFVMFGAPDGGFLDDQRETDPWVSIQRQWYRRDEVIYTHFCQ